MTNVLKKVCLILAVTLTVSSATLSTPEIAEAQSNRARVTRAQNALRDLCINLDALNQILDLFNNLRAFLGALQGLLDAAFRPPNINPNCIGLPNIPGLDVNGLLDCLRNSIQINPNFQMSCTFNGPALSFNDPRRCIPPIPTLDLPNLEDLLNQCVQLPIFDPEAILQQIRGMLQGILDPLLNFRIPVKLPGLIPRLEVVCRDFGYLGGRSNARLKISAK